MGEWWREIAGLVLPVACGGCGTPRTELCAECGAALSETPPRRVRPSPEPCGLPVVHAVAPYENAVRALLLAHKERGALVLTRPLGGALAAAVRAGAGRSAQGGPLLLVPVPSARRSTAARGHDPVRRLARAAAAGLRRAGTPARVLPVLRQRRPVEDQAGLRAVQRRANLAGALETVPGGERLLAAGRVVLVDDLLTTGATLAEAARAVGPHLARAAERPLLRAAERPLPRAAERTLPRAAGAWSPHAEGPQLPGAAGGRPLWAAVIAASPSAFEINRN